MTTLPTPPSPEHDESGRGLIYAVSAFVMWGMFPLFWKNLSHVNSLELVGHRMVWSLMFVGGVLLALRRTAWIREVLKQPRVIAVYAAATVFIGFNWGLYIWAVNSGFIVETALGYFINPLFNVIIGAAFLRETLRRGQWMAVGFAAVGVVWLTVSYGELPWIALLLAGSFSVYSVIKRKATLGAIEGLGLECSLLFFPGLAILAYMHATTGGAFGSVSVSTHLLLISAGAASALPLMFFSAGVKRLKLTVIGLIQYIGPTIQFLLGVFVYNEQLGSQRLIGFAFIWAGVLAFTIEGFMQRKKARLAKA